jgi:hypothetical protein
MSQAEAMSRLRSLAETYPLLFVIALAIVQPIHAMPFVPAVLYGSVEIAAG